MIPLGQAKTKRLVAVHGWSGVLLASLLYVVVLSGTVVVFAHELDIWAQGATPAATPLDQPIDSIVRKHARATDPVYLEEVTVGQTLEGHLSMFFHTHTENASGQISDKGVHLVVDTERDVVISRKEGFAVEIFRGESKSALEEFLVQLHIRLHIPGFLGLLVTGVLGLWMMISGVSGLLAHRHAIRDIFVPERPGDRLVSARDRHVLAGTWSLVFAFVLAFTGSFFSFAGSIGIPVVGMVAFGGDQEALIETAIGVPRPEDTRAASLASLDYIVHDATSRAGADAERVIILHYGRADATVLVQHSTAEGNLIPTTTMFDGATRAYMGIKPFLGTVPSAANTAVGLMAPLHFGDFAGLFSKVIWAALGSAMCFVILTGVRLWLRRRAEEPGWGVFRRFMVAVTYGFPLAMVASAYGYFIALPVDASVWWTAASFVAVSIFSLIYGLLRTDVQHTAYQMRRALGLSLIVLPLLRLLTGGTAWSDAALAGQVMIPSIDILLLLGGAILLFWPSLIRALSRGPSNISRAIPGPAE